MMSRRDLQYQAVGMRSLDFGLCKFVQNESVILYSSHLTGFVMRPKCSESVRVARHGDRACINATDLDVPDVPDQPRLFPGP